MRTTLFRTVPVLVNAANVVAALVDIDGAEPFTLFVENLDLKAALTTTGLFRTKNANLLFTAATAGVGGNAITVQFLISPKSVFGISVVGNAITITLQGDAAGSPYSEKNRADKVMDAINANGPASALVTASLAPGSDGSGVLDISANTAVLSLAGGAASAALAVASIEVATSSLPPAQTMAGGWVVNAAAGTDFGTVGANSVVAREFTSGKAPGAAADVAMFRSLRVRASQGAAPTSIVVSAVVKRKIL